MKKATQSISINTYDSKKNFIEQVYKVWLEKSIKQKLSWYNAIASEKLKSKEFEKEMKEKIHSLLPELQIKIKQKEKKQETIIRVRSKKKRIRKKHEKKRNVC